MFQVIFIKFIGQNPQCYPMKATFYEVKWIFYLFFNWIIKVEHPYQ